MGAVLQIKNADGTVTTHVLDGPIEMVALYTPDSPPVPTPAPSDTGSTVSEPSAPPVSAEAEPPSTVDSTVSAPGSGLDPTKPESPDSSVSSTMQPEPTDTSTPDSSPTTSTDSATVPADPSVVPDASGLDPTTGAGSASESSQSDTSPPISQPTSSDESSATTPLTVASSVANDAITQAQAAVSAMETSPDPAHIAAAKAALDAAQKALGGS